jgi:predicted PurR-regulated permease PerM
LAPALRRLRRLHIGRVPAVTLTVLIAFLAMLGFAAIIVQEISTLAQQIPEYRSNLETKIRSLPGVVPDGAVFHRVTSLVQELSRELTQSETQIAKSANDRSGIGTSSVEPTKPVPVEIRGPDFAPLPCCGLPIGIGLALIGIPNAALWGIFAALLRFLPHLGIVIAASFPVALAAAVDPGWMLLVWVILLFVGVELLVANLLEPWVYAPSTGLSSVALIAAATFWTWLWGPIGLLLSTL